MSCQQDHTKLTSNYCPECGVAKPVVLSIEDNIAKQLNEIIKEIVDETNEPGFYKMQKDCDDITMIQNELLMKKIMQRGLNIPNGMLFVITTGDDKINRIFTLNDVYKSYPSLRQIDLKGITKNFGMNDDKHFQKMYSFLLANGDYAGDKFVNRRFDKYQKIFESDEFKTSGFTVEDIFNDNYIIYKDQAKSNEFKQTGFPISALIDGTYGSFKIILSKFKEESPANRKLFIEALSKFV